MNINIAFVPGTAKEKYTNNTGENREVCKGEESLEDEKLGGESKHP